MAHCRPFLLTIMLLSTAIQGFAQLKQHEQLPQKRWEYEFAEGDYEGTSNVAGVTEDVFGNILYTGYVQNPTAGFDLAVVKTSRYGKVIWKRKVTGDGYAANQGQRIVTDPFGNIYILGTLFLDNQYQLVLLKFSTTGQMLWQVMIKEYGYNPTASQLFMDLDHVYIFYGWRDTDYKVTQNFTKVDLDGKINIQKNILLPVDSFYSSSDRFSISLFNGSFFSGFQSLSQPDADNRAYRLCHLDKNGEIIFYRNYAYEENLKIIGGNAVSTFISLRDTLSKNLIITGISQNGTTTAFNDVTLAGQGKYAYIYGLAADQKQIQYSVMHVKNKAQYNLVKWDLALNIETEFPVEVPEYPNAILADTSRGVFLVYYNDSGITIYNYDSLGKINWTNHFEGSSKDVEAVKLLKYGITICMNPRLPQSSPTNLFYRGFVTIHFDKYNGKVSGFEYGDNATSSTSIRAAMKDHDGNLVVLASNRFSDQHSEYILRRLNPAGYVIWSTTKPPVFEPGDVFQGWYIDAQNNIVIFLKDNMDIIHRLTYTSDGLLKEDKPIQIIPLLHNKLSFTGDADLILGIANSNFYPFDPPIFRTVLLSGKGEVIADKYLLQHGEIQAVQYDKEKKLFRLILRIDDKVQYPNRLELWKIYQNGEIDKKLLSSNVRQTDIPAVFHQDGSFGLLRFISGYIDSLNLTLEEYTPSGTLKSKYPLDDLVRIPGYSTFINYKLKSDREDNYIFSTQNGKILGNERFNKIFKFDRKGHLVWTFKSYDSLRYSISSSVYINHDNDVFVHQSDYQSHDSLIKIDENGAVMWRMGLENNAQLRDLIFDNNYIYEVGSYVGMAFLRKYIDPSINAIALPSPAFFMEAYPNPTTSDITVSYQIQDTADASFFIYDTKGRLINTFDEGSQPPGIHHFHYQFTPNYVPGIYLIRLQAGDQAKALKVVCSRK